MEPNTDSQSKPLAQAPVGTKIERIAPGVCAIDIGSDALFVAIADQPVKRFGTFTSELILLGEFLQKHGIVRVAMEATGVYWVPLHDHLDKCGFEVTLFHGAHARNLPGRKTDVADCQWHAMLHSHGLLSPCFIPPAEIRELRALYRLREDHLGLSAMYVQQMQKALVLMNVRLHEVISQLCGVSGLRVVEAILAGERNPQTLAGLCAGQILSRKRPEVEASLVGTWDKHHLFALGQALEGYKFCQTQMKACDAQIERWLEEATRDLPAQEVKGSSVVRHNAPVIAGLHQKLVDLCGGCDAAVLPGISPLSFLKLVSELGTDLSRWKDEKHFTSWLGLAPGRHESGKSRKRVARRKTKAGQIFKECAMSLSRSKGLALGGFYRRLKGRTSAGVANTATARKLAQLYYRLMTKGLEYVEQGLEEYEKQYQQQALQRLKKMAQKMGISLLETQTGTLL